VIGHNADRIADGPGVPGLHPALVSAQPAIDIDTSRERVHPWIVEPVVSANSTCHKLHLNVVRSEIAEPDQCADVDFGSDLHLLPAERLHVLNRNPRPRFPNPPLPNGQCLRSTGG
jgi:hypothetical protein